VAERRRKAQKKMDSLRKKGRTISPVSVDGRAIAQTFWGKAWCDNLESYSDFSNRLPRGRTYVRNGSVVDLQVAAGQIVALVSGSEIYEVKVNILPVAKPRWKAICEDCAGSIDSLVELLRGRLSKGVMERICQQQTGLFPSPKEIRLSCSCPDWAEMCKHVAAVLYGVGARLDQQPELLFRLREVNEKELIASAGKSLPRTMRAQSAEKVLGGEDLSKLFGLDLAESAPPQKAARGKKTPAAKAKILAPGTKPLQKSVPAESTAKLIPQTKPALKKKPAPVLAKSKPAKGTSGKKGATIPTKKRETSTKKSALPAAKNKSAAGAGKATPAKPAAAKKLADKQTLPKGLASTSSKSIGRRSAITR
jgi:uncharacterized Zn finger protein